MSYINAFTTSLVTNTTAGETSSQVVDVPALTPPYSVAFDATDLNGNYEVVTVTSVSSTNLNHSATTNNHTTAEEIRVILPAADLDTLSTDVETVLADSAASTPTGAIRPWPTTSAPTGYLSCTGVTASRTTYAGLFAVIGETFGVGDGVTTFNLPDASGRMVMGRDTGDGDFDLADTGGAKTASLEHAHTANTHTHTVSATTSASSNTTVGTSDQVAVANASHTHTMTVNVNTQSDRGSNNQLSATQSILMPYTTLNLIIKT